METKQEEIIMIKLQWDELSYDQIIPSYAIKHHTDQGCIVYRVLQYCTMINPATADRGAEWSSWKDVKMSWMT